MKEPRRLDQGNNGHVAHALLEAGRCYRASPQTHAKTLAALGIAGSTILTTGSAAAAGSQLVKIGWANLGWAKLVLGISALSAAIVVPTAYSALQAHHGSELAAHQNQASAILLSGGERSAVDDAPAPPPRSEDSERDFVETQTQTQTQARPRTGTSTTANQPEGRAGTGRSSKGGARTTQGAALTAELSMVDAARSVLANGDARSALALLEAYSRLYPHGHLELEADVLRMDALARSGQSGAATKHAEAFLRRHPNSVLATRARGFLAD